MNLVLLTFGKLDQSFYQQAAAEYQKRLSRFAKLQIIELKEEKKTDLTKNRQLDTENCLKRLEAFKDYQVWFLDLFGPCLSSENLALAIQKVKNQGTGKMLFVIGPSNGLDMKLIPKHYHRIAFGRITLPHQLCRVILLEQLYRGFKIINDENYHK